MLVFLPPAKCWKIRFWRPAKNRYFLITNPFEKLQFSACRRGGHFQTSKGSIFYDYIWMYTMWGWNAYTMRLECLQHEAWRYTAWGLKVYCIQYDCVWGLKVYTMRPESIHYQAWMYTAWGLKIYTVRPECMQHHVWKHTLWGLKVYSTRPVSITVLGLEVYSTSLENIQYDSWVFVHGFIEHFILFHQMCLNRFLFKLLFGACAWRIK